VEVSTGDNFSEIVVKATENFNRFLQVLNPPLKLAGFEQEGGYRVYQSNRHGEPKDEPAINLSQPLSAMGQKSFRFTVVAKESLVLEVDEKSFSIIVKEQQDAARAYYQPLQSL
jgi:hypothetical protein